MGENASSAYEHKKNLNAASVDHQPPIQELGGYGRCMADFAWDLRSAGTQFK